MADPVEQKARERFETWSRTAVFVAAERSVVSAIVEKLEKRIAELEAKLILPLVRVEELLLCGARAELERQVAELKRDYLGEK